MVSTGTVRGGASWVVSAGRPPPDRRRPRALARFIDAGLVKLEIPLGNPVRCTTLQETAVHPMSASEPGPLRPGQAGTHRPRRTYRAGSPLEGGPRAPDQPAHSGGHGEELFAGVGYRMAPDRRGTRRGPSSRRLRNRCAVGDSITAGYLAPVSWPTLMTRWDHATVTNLGGPAGRRGQWSSTSGMRSREGAGMTIMGGTNDCAYASLSVQAAVRLLHGDDEEAGCGPAPNGPLPRAKGGVTGRRFTHAS